ncbi:MAG: hypothetical protein H6718_18815 [Polyangiaceae bacterium]|nr:hypothetical protein [Myxococcales bacterium]MCB9587460.1 hypothetical protein [Polyangiaceae bacterium]MCB9605743.1 hypothetical protein [Polyangiaceae bacterium]
MSSPIDALVDQLRTSLHAQRRDTAARVEAIQSAAQAYLSAVEQQIVRDFSTSHGFGNAPGGASPKQAAERLLSAVRQLPELKDAPTAPVDPTPNVEPKRAAARLTPEKNPPAASSLAPKIETKEPASKPRLALLALTEQRPLVLVGRLGKKERLEALASELPKQVEWLDTNQHGMAAIGNLDRRLRERRVGALVLMEGSLSHKHTEPLVSAARQHGIAFAYANKGGKQSILRALDELEKQLASG